MVRDDIVLGTQQVQEPVAGVVGPPLHGDGPFQHRPDPHVDESRRGTLGVPDRRKDLQHVGARDLRHRDIPDAREGVDLQGAEPVPRVRGAPPPGPLLLDHPLGGLGEGGDAHQPPLLRERIAARSGELAVGERLFAGLGQRDQFNAAESEFALAPPDDEPLDPTPRSRLLDVEVESVPVAVPTGRSGAHEGSREPLVGMAALGLASTAFRGRNIHIIHPLIVAGMERDCKGRSWTDTVGEILPKAL